MFIIFRNFIALHQISFQLLHFKSQSTLIQSLIFLKVLNLLRMPKTTKISKSPKLKKVQRKCNAHQFFLKPVSENMIHSINLSMSFCLSNGKKTQSLKTGKSGCLDYPCFNSDANIATPTFILNSQKSYYSQRKDKMLQEHEQKMVNYTDQKSSLNVPKPRTKSSYCSVCRMSYEDYLDHINSYNHHKRIQQSQFNPHILQLTNRFNQSKTKGEHQDKRVIEGNTENQEGTYVDSDQVQIISNPHKKVYVEEHPIRQQNYIQLQPQPCMVPITDMHQFRYFRPFSSIFQDDINRIHQGYNMNMLMNPYFNYRPFQMSSFKSCLPFPYYPYPQINNLAQSYPISKPITYIVIDE